MECWPLGQLVHLSLSTIPAFAAPVIRATAILTVLTLRALGFVAFAAVVLFPPATVQVTMSVDDAARHCHHTYCDHRKTKTPHDIPPKRLDGATEQLYQPDRFSITNEEARKKAWERDSSPAALSVSVWLLDSSL